MAVQPPQPHFSRQAADTLALFLWALEYVESEDLRHLATQVTYFKRYQIYIVFQDFRFVCSALGMCVAHW